MANMGKVLITGATGFVGRHVARAVGRAGYGVRALVRPSSDRAVLLGGPRSDRDPASAPPEFHVGDVTQPATLEGACDGCAGVVHLVGVINEKRGRFDDIHVAGTRNLLAQARAAGVRRFIFLSGLGARPDAPARYHQTKFAAEQAVLDSGLQGYVFPASVIFGPQDAFLNLFVKMARSWWNPPWPLLPVAGGGRALLQPVWVEDVAECLARALAPDFALPPGRYELAGPDTLSLRQVMRLACRAARRRRWLVPVPRAVLWPVAWLLETSSPAPLLTRDQLAMLNEDNRARENMTARILARPPRSLADYVAEQFGILSP